jgi:hypothetical protein
VDVILPDQTRSSLKTSQVFREEGMATIALLTSE